jgi:hypothetical protein
VFASVTQNMMERDGWLHHVACASSAGELAQLGRANHMASS